MKRHFLAWMIGIVGLGAGQQPAAAQVATWATPLPPATANYEDTRSLTDPAGNTYVAGRYTGALALGPARLPAPTGPGRNGFLAKIGPTGLVQWALAGFGTDEVRVQALALNPNGGVYAVFRADSLRAGTASNQVFSFGGLSARHGVVLAKVNPAGTVMALPVLHGGATAATVTGLAADTLGRCYLSVVAPTSSFAARFGPYTFPTPTSSAYQSVTSALFALYPLAGGGPASAPILLRALVPTPQPLPGGQLMGGLQVDDLQVGPTGDLYLAGTLSGTITLSGGSVAPVTLTAPNQGTGGCNFVTRLSFGSAAPRWGLVGSETLAALVTDPNNVKLAVGSGGEVYLAGTSIFSSFTFGGLPVGAGGYVLKISNTGRPRWARAVPTSTTALGFETTRNAARVAVDAAGHVYRLGVLTLPTATFGTSTVSHPFPTPVGGRPDLAPAFYLASYDSAGTARWARTAGGALTPSRSGTYTHSGAGLGADRNGNLYLLASLAANTSAPFNAQLQLDGQVIDEGYTLLRLDTQARLSGALYIDQNGNGQRDAGEGPFPYPQVVTDPGTNRTYSSATTGEYSFFGAPGSAYSLSIPSPHRYYTLSSPAARTGTFPAVGQTTTGLDFGLVPLPNPTDVRATLTPVGAARPGFTVRYRLTLENLGATTVSGNANMVLDSRFSYVSSAPNGSRSGQTVTWAYTNLAPFAQLNFEVLLSLPTNAVPGTVLGSSATAPLAGDLSLDDNTATADQTVTASYDPNDIAVNYVRLSPTQVAAGLPLDYVVRFQNMGTDTAFAVVITDTLDYARLNLSTMELIAQSHNCVWSLTGRGLLTVRFSGIKLPHRNVDVIRSQGFVRFRMRPRPTLAVGDIVPNKADIFFDFNAPVRTNTATTTVMLASAALARHSAEAWNAYPNPATDAVTIAADLATAGPVRLDLLDALGRPVRRQTFAAPAGPLRQALDLRGLAPGYYVLRLTPPTGPASSQPLVRE